MSKTISRTKSIKSTNANIAQNVERIIKAAMLETTSPDLKKRIQDFVTNSLATAKDKSMHLKKDVTKYAHKKPYRSLGLVLLTSAVIGLVVRSSLRKE